MKLKSKVILLVLFAALVPGAIVTPVILWKTENTGEEVDRKVSELVYDSVDTICRGVYDLVETSDRLIQGQVNQALIAAHTIVKRVGDVQLSAEKVEWEAVNQFTKAKETTPLPKLLLGTTWLGQNRDPAVETPVVDEIFRMAGGTATIFQRMNETGDMIRVATTVKTTSGERAVGTYIPVTNPDGTPNPVLSAVLKGETYRGRAFVVNAWYLTAYEPLRDKDNEIVGMTYVGIEQNDLQALRAKLLGTKVGADGYVWVVGGKGDQKGKYIVSKGGKSDDVVIWDTPDDKGNLFVQNLINRAMAAQAAKPGSVIFEEYRWQNPSDAAPSMRLSAARYYEPWDWVVGANIGKEDIAKASEEVTESIRSLILWAIGGGLSIALLASLLAVVMGARFTRPIGMITEAAGTIASGNLSGASKSLEAAAGEMGLSDRRAHGAGDETEELLRAIQTMTQNLNSLIGKVQQMGIQVTSSSTEIAASARQLEANVSDQAASTNEVLSTTTEITGVSKELVDVMRDVGVSAGKAAELAGAGQTDLRRMGDGMQQLAAATRSISGRLAVIDEKTDNVKTVVTTISKVADQTNLLSLNASIEAEKAGEYGRGFSVVAREIQRLADQTAIAAMDIERIVNEMRSAVRTGVMEMDNFTREVTTFVEEVNRINSQQETIIKKVQELIPAFEEVSEGVKSQSTGAEQIRDAIVRLSEGAEQTAQALGEFKLTATSLNATAKGLQEEISRFVVSS